MRSENRTVTHRKNRLPIRPSAEERTWSVCTARSTASIKCLLGVEFSLLLGLQYDKNGKNLQCGRNLLDFPLIGMLCAVTDETIQIFSGRGSLVSDVWIDTAGFSTGFFLTVLLFLFINHCKKAG